MFPFIAFTLCLSFFQTISAQEWVAPTPAMFHDQPSINHYVTARSEVTFPVTLVDYIDMSTLIWTNASAIEATIQFNQQTITVKQLSKSVFAPTLILPRTAENSDIDLISVCDSINQARNITSRSCTVNITLFNRDYVDRVFMHSVSHMKNMGADDAVTMTVDRGGWAYFAVPLTTGDTSLLISLSISSSPAGQNADLYISNEEAESPDDYLFPYRTKGVMWYHPPGEDMKLLLGPSPGNRFVEGIYIFALYSPIITPAPRSQFTLEFTSRVGRTNSFTAGLFGIIGAVIVLVLCLFAAAALVARNRRRSQLTVLSHQVSQLENGQTVFIASNGRMMMVTVHPVEAPAAPPGVPREQIDALPVLTYEKIGDDEGRCTICLEDYVDGVSRLKRLPCGHDFDILCIEQWLTAHKQCPLCQQNIDTAHDVAKHDPHTIAKPPVAEPSLNVIEMQSVAQHGHVVEISQQEEFKESHY